VAHCADVTLLGNEGVKQSCRKASNERIFMVWTLGNGRKKKKGKQAKEPTLGGASESCFVNRKRGLSKEVELSKIGAVVKAIQTAGRQRGRPTPEKRRKKSLIRQPGLEGKGKQEANNSQKASQNTQTKKEW